MIRVKGLNWASSHGSRGQEGRGEKVIGLRHGEHTAISLVFNLLGGWGWDMFLVCLRSQSIRSKVFIESLLCVSHCSRR